MRLIKADLFRPLAVGFLLGVAGCWLLVGGEGGKPADVVAAAHAEAVR